MVVSIATKNAPTWFLGDSNLAFFEAKYFSKTWAVVGCGSALLVFLLLLLGILPSYPAILKTGVVSEVEVEADEGNVFEYAEFGTYNWSDFPIDRFISSSWVKTSLLIEFVALFSGAKFEFWAISLMCVS